MKYIYYYTEQSVDVRVVKIKSNELLTREEVEEIGVNNAVELNQNDGGHLITRWTEYGDDTQTEVSEHNHKTNESNRFKESKNDN